MAFGDNEKASLGRIEQATVNQPQNRMYDWGERGGDLNGMSVTTDGKLLQVIYDGAHGDYIVRTLSQGVTAIFAGPRVDGERTDVQAEMADGKIRWLTWDGAHEGDHLPAGHHWVKDGDGWHYIDLEVEG